MNGSKKEFAIKGITANSIVSLIQDGWGLDSG